MNDDPNPSPRDFPTTCWWLVHEAGVEDSEGSREALAELLKQYLPALRAHLIHRHSMPPERADDLVQGFISENILQRDLLTRADNKRGKFRTLLLTALHRYVVDQWRAEQAKKRRGNRAVSLDAEGQENLARTEVTASSCFDLAWARRVLSETLRRMEEECESTRRQDVWGVFQTRLIAPILHGERPLPYEQLVERFDLSTPRRATNVLITGKRMFARILRTVVGEYTPEEEIEAEIQQLQLDLAIPSAPIASSTGPP